MGRYKLKTGDMVEVVPKHPKRAGNYALKFQGENGIIVKRLIGLGTAAFDVYLLDRGRVLDFYGWDLKYLNLLKKKIYITGYRNEI